MGSEPIIFGPHLDATSSRHRFASAYSLVVYINELVDWIPYRVIMKDWIDYGCIEFVGKSNCLGAFATKCQNPLGTWG